MAAEFSQRRQAFVAQGLEFSEDVLRGEIRETFRSVVVMEWLKDNVKRHTLPYDPAAAAAAEKAAAPPPPKAKD